MATRGGSGRASSEVSGVGEESSGDVCAIGASVISVASTVSASSVSTSIVIRVSTYVEIGESVTGATLIP